jgi:3-hydroxybutyryl-CoA dehydrogenase
MLTELIEKGRYGVKQGGDLVTPAGDQAPLIAYRNTAYARLGQLLKELGPGRCDHSAISGPDQEEATMTTAPYTAR